MTDTDKKPPLDEDYLDSAEYESDVDMDFDSDSEDGLFTSDEQIKSKSGHKITYIVMLLALLGGGAFYFYNKQEQVLSLPAPQDVATASSALPVVPTPASDFDPTSPPVSSEVVLNQEEGGVTLPDVPNSPDAPEGVSEVGSGSETAAPSLNEAVSPVASAPDEEASLPQATPPPEISKEIKTEAAQEIPDTAELQPAPKVEAPPKKNELEAARETINLPEKKAQPERTVYFDAPKGKALTDIPPPSINPMGEPGESIIIVHKGGRKSDDLIVEKGEDNGFIESKLINANRAASLGRYDAALGFYKEMYKKNPRDPRILMGRAVTLQKLGDTHAAIDAYRELLDIEPNNPEAITNLMGLIGKTQPAVALQNLLDLREKYPRNADVAAQLGVAYTQSGNPQDGIKYLNMAAGLQPDNPQHFFNMAVICERLNDREKAIKYYEQSLDVFAVNGSGKNTAFSREQIYDRLAALRGN